ncbi:DUF433 domain-containing protein [Chitinophaga japonensis]
MLTAYPHITKESIYAALKYAVLKIKGE